MLDEGAEVFYPNPMWIRKDRLQEYVDPYIEDGLLKHGLKGPSLYIYTRTHTHKSALIPNFKMASINMDSKGRSLSTHTLSLSLARAPHTN